MVKTITDTIVEERKFTKEALKILKSLGYLNFGLNKKKIEEMMAKEGYKRGYKGVWISSDDIIPDDQ